VDLFLCKIDPKPDHNWEKNGTENQDDRHTQIFHKSIHSFYLTTQNLIEKLFLNEGVTHTLISFLQLP
jgi:hypothetical protein